MNYDELYIKFTNMFPDDKEVFDKLSEQYDADINDGMHIVFGMIIVPYLKTIVLSNEVKAKRAFDFIEEMEISGDSMIAEVVECTIIEGLIGSEEEIINKCLNLMGSETKAAYYDVAKWFKKD